MKHIQKFADSLLKLFAPSGLVTGAWADASSENLHIRHREGHAAAYAWEDAWMDLQETNQSVWDVAANQDTGSSDALYLKAEAFAYPETSKSEYRLTMYVDVSTTRENGLTILLDKKSSTGKFQTLYKTGTGTFYAKDWDRVSKSSKSPEKVLRKFLEEFDSKGFALGSHSKVTSSRQFSPKFLKDLVSEIHHNAQKKFSGSDLEDMSDRNLPTQLDYLLSAYDPQHDSSADFAKAHTAEIADFFKMSGHEQAKALSGVFKGL